MNVQVTKCNWRGSFKFFKSLDFFSFFYLRIFFKEISIKKISIKYFVINRNKIEIS